MYSSFKFYFSNEASNVLLPKIKVVDLEILSKFGIQKFFIWGHVEGEKLNLQTALWKLRAIYRNAITSISLSSLSVFRRDDAVRRRRTSGTASRPLVGHAPCPRFLLEASRPRHAAPSPGAHAEDGCPKRHGDDAPSRAVCPL